MRASVFTGLLAILLIAGCSGSDSSTSSGGASDGSLSTAEVATLTYMREEEKLARDVYLTLYERWRMDIFSNIASSEQQHMDTMAAMINRYGIADPVTSNAVGSFTNPSLDALYDRLVAQGRSSRDAAIEVGIFIETTDITDLQRAIDESTHADLDQAYQNLLSGSYNHLAAFNAQPR